MLLWEHRYPLPDQLQIIGRDHPADSARSWPGAFPWQLERVELDKDLFAIKYLSQIIRFCFLTVTSQGAVTLLRHNEAQIVVGLREILAIMKSILHGHQLAWTYC